MPSQIRDGETLVVAKLDRLGRHGLDVGATIKALGVRKIQVIVLQLGKLDLASSTGKMKLTMLAAVGEMERDVLVERTQAGLARAKQQGMTLGRPTKTNEKQRTEIIAKHQAGANISELSWQYGVSRLSNARIAKLTVIESSMH
ncbi:MAG: recombinase family protein [Noviherbaspirillum sp.]